MKALKCLPILVLPLVAAAQSSLPLCPPTGVKHNCIAAIIFPNGFKYVGEWRDDLRNGAGIEYRANGNISRSGQWADWKLLQSYEIDPNRFPFNSPSEIAVPTALSPEQIAATQQPRVQSGRSKPAIGDVSACAPKDEDYPAAAVRTNATGTTRIRFTVGQTGYLINSEIVKTSGKTRSHRQLDRVALAKLSECKFAAGVSANGSPTGGTFEVEYVWKLTGFSGGRSESFVSPSVTYNGTWKNGELVGIGTMSLPGGEAYIGELKDGKQDGKGRYYFGNGILYHGEFLNGLRHGSGIEYSSEGSIIQSGTWKDGNFTLAHAVDTFLYHYAPRESLISRLFNSKTPATTTATGSQSTQQTSSEVEVERRKRQELEQRLAAAEARERERPAPPPLTTSTTIRSAHALVIGNAAYPDSGRLNNPVNDATDISQKLRSMGFTVTTVTDANRQLLVQAMSQFRREAVSAQVSVLFYSGHAVQVSGKNYILPTDADQNDLAQATIQAVSLNEVVESFLPGNTRLVFLDASRDSPLHRTGDRNVSRGLAHISVGEGTLIAYATKDGQVASDGAGQRNSPFTQALLEHLSDPTDIAVVLRKVREKVMRATGGRQQPWEYGSLTGGELVLSAIRPQK
jgi:TonB family protein